MSFDLYFSCDDNCIPSISELKHYFAALPFFQIKDVEDGVDFWYHNEVTGVYAHFSRGSSELAFNINYNRPSFFAYETMPLWPEYPESTTRQYNCIIILSLARLNGGATSE